MLCGMYTEIICISVVSVLCVIEQNDLRKIFFASNENGYIINRWRLMKEIIRNHLPILSDGRVFGLMFLVGCPLN